MISGSINGICGMVNMADHYADDMEKQKEYRTKVKEASNLRWNW